MQDSDMAAHSSVALQQVWTKKCYEMPRRFYLGPDVKNVVKNAMRCRDVFT